MINTQCTIAQVSNFTSLVFAYKYCNCFEQVVPSNSGNYRVQIHSKRVYDTIKTHENAKTPYKYVLTTQRNKLVSLAK